MSLRMTVVVDNRARPGLVAEHGFSLYIEHDEGHILFDTGNRDALIANMNTLGIDAGKISTLVLSHGHYDHSGGIDYLLRTNSRVSVYLHPLAFQTRYTIDDEPTSVSMGKPAIAALKNHPAERVYLLDGPARLTPEIGISGPISRTNMVEDTGGPFFLDLAGTQVDEIDDDQAMWIKTEAGLVVCLGCCHSGLVNTLEAITAQAGEQNIAAIIGGMHLLHSSEERLQWTVKALARYTIGRIIACHCSGDEAVSYLARHLDADVSMGESGMRMTF